MSATLPNVQPWYAPSSESNRGRFVIARASLIAASTASVPELASVTLEYAPPVRSHSSFANRPANGFTRDGNHVGTSESSTSRTAAVIAGWR